MVHSSALSPVIIITRPHPFNCSLLMTHHIGHTTFLGVLCPVVTAVHCLAMGPFQVLSFQSPIATFQTFLLIWREWGFAPLGRDLTYIWKESWALVSREAHVQTSVSPLLIRIFNLFICFWFTCLWFWLGGHQSPKKVLISEKTPPVNKTLGEFWIFFQLQLFGAEQREAVKEMAGTNEPDDSKETKSSDLFVWDEASQLFFHARFMVFFFLVLVFLPIDSFFISLFLSFLLSCFESLVAIAISYRITPFKFFNFCNRICV